VSDSTEYKMNDSHNAEQKKPGTKAYKPQGSDDTQNKIKHKTQLLEVKSGYP
jgi:hypothetical protein